MHGTQTLDELDRAGAAPRRSNLAEQVVFWLFVAGLAWVPLSQGSNGIQAWGINALLFPSLTAAYELSLVIGARPHPVGIRTIGVPALLFLAVVLWVFTQAATATPQFMHNAIWGLAADALGVPIGGSISVNRDMTVQALARLMTAASVLWLALQLGRDAARANRLIAALAAICVAYACYGLLNLTVAGGYVTSTFTNRNNFATYAGIGAIILTGLLLRHYRGAAAAGAFRLRTAAFIETTGKGGAVYICGLFVIVAALLLSGSRGGIIAALFGGTVLLTLSLAQGRKRAAGQGIAILFALATLVVVAGFGDTLIGKIEVQGFGDDARLAVYRLVLESIGKAPILGYGYGTFADVFPLFRDRSLDTGGTWLMAHNTYLEVLQGLGALFGAALIASVAVLVLRCLRGAQRRKLNATLPCIAGSVGCLVAVNALVDFSLQIQAVTLTFMAVLGAGVAQAESSQLVLHD